MLAHLMLAVLGAVMLASSLLVKAVGLPAQIRENRRTGSAPRGMRWFITFGLLSYSSQTLWFCVQGDWLAALAQGPGVLGTAILAWQMVRYRVLAEPSGLHVSEEPPPLVSAEGQHRG